MHKIDDSTESKQHLTDRIVQYATKEFLSKGIKAVKMDDIARGLAISKRTLYETFDNKENLLMDCVRRMQTDTHNHMDIFIKEKCHSVIEIVVEFYRYQMQRFTGVSPEFLVDIHKYPAVMKWMETFRDSREKEAIDFFSLGVEEGYFQKDVNYKLIVRICDGSMEYVFQHRLFDEYSLKQILTDVTMLYIRGFCTLKGIEALEKLL